MRLMWAALALVLLPVAGARAQGAPSEGGASSENVERLAHYETGRATAA